MPPPSFPQRLEKNTEEQKYHNIITVAKTSIHQCSVDISSRENYYLCKVYEGYGYEKKISVLKMTINCNIVVL